MRSARWSVVAFSSWFAAWISIGPAPSAAEAEGDAAIAASHLRCEARADPLGVDARKPRLSWRFEAPGRDQRQTAWRVLVAATPEALERDQGDLWDSGKIEGARGAEMEAAYAGKPLRSHQKCWWKARTWDKSGHASPWSKATFWSMGPLEASDWHNAEWVGFDRHRQPEAPEAPLEGAQWIWHAGDQGPNKPKGHRLFVATWTLPPSIEIASAELVATADDFFHFTINGAEVASGQPGSGGWDQPKAADIAARLKPGADNTIRVEVQNGSPGPAGLLAKLVANTTDGKTLTLVTDEHWKTSDNPGANWHNRPLDTKGWPSADVLGDYGMAPWGKLKLARLVLPPPSLLRGKFQVDGPVRRAVLYATALGIFDAHLNGRRVGDDYFNPGWTDYNRRVYYRAWDVTGQIQPGENAWGAALADGWYSGYVGFGKKRDHYGARPRFMALLHVEMKDGKTADFTTGPDWKASVGPIAEADFLMGETVDARKAIDGWDAPGFDDQSWAAVDRGAQLGPAVQWHPGPPVHVFAELKPKSVKQPTPGGAYVFDMGQNFAGLARIKVHADPGRKITMRFAERLNPDGTIYTTNLREARATDTYICKGGGEETWSPRFTFHGFQYVELSGLPAPPNEETLTGLALSSATPVVGSFSCSDPMLNQLFQNIYWTQRANFIDVPTDCPQRDERLGWTGDAQIYVGTASLICDVQAFFHKWLIDLADGQRDDGQFPMVAPVKVAGNDGGPAWADAGVVCPWTIYEMYGDRALLARQYPSMVKFVEFCRERSTPELLPPKQFHCFGDWLSIQADTPKDVIYTAYFAHSARLTARAAEALGKSDDHAKYQQLADAVKAAFNRAFVAPDGKIQGDTQACYAMAIDFGLVDGAARAQAARRLVANIEGRGNHLSTGFVGTKSLMAALSKIDRTDVAYRLLHNDTFPSWGFSIKQGATSIWERWDGWTPEKGFQDPGMNSFAHYSFGAVYQWMFNTIGGIHVDAPRRRFLIAPRPDPKLEWAKTSYDGRSGTVATSWKRERGADGGNGGGGGALSLEVIVPPNTSALLRLPANGPDKVREGGRALDQAEGLKAGPHGDRDGDRDDGVWVEIGSGTYRFTIAE